jgi:hypothetical protein
LPVRGNGSDDDRLSAGERPTPDDPAINVMSGGTTGVPKPWSDRIAVSSQPACS